MKNRLLFIVILIALIFFSCESPTNDESGDDEDTSCFLALFADEFSSAGIGVTVTIGGTETSDYAGYFAVYTEDFAGYESGISIHLMTPGSSGSMVTPGSEWFIIKIQSDSMTPGTYTLDSSDQTFQLSSPGQVKIYQNDSSDILHCASGQLIINSFEWSHSGDYSANLSFNIEFSDIAFDGGNADLGISRSLGETGSGSGTLNAVAEKMDLRDPTNSTWQTRYDYYGTNFTEEITFTSTSSCSVLVYETANSSSRTTDTLTVEDYNYDYSVATGYLKGSQGNPLYFEIKGNTLTTDTSTPTQYTRIK